MREEFIRCSFSFMSIIVHRGQNFIGVWPDMIMLFKEEEQFDTKSSHLSHVKGKMLHIDKQLCE